MGTFFDESLAVVILVASIDIPQLIPTTAAIQTLANKDVKWEDVNAMLIDKAKPLKNGPRNRSSAATQCNALCGKTKQNTDTVF